MPAVIIRELTKPESGSEVHPGRLYGGSVARFRGMVFTGRSRRNSYQGNQDKPAPADIRVIAEQCGYKTYTTTIEK